MAAKLLNSWKEDNPNLIRHQVGCMKGVFHMFDRPYMLNNRRISGRNHKKLEYDNHHSNGSGQVDEEETEDLFPQTKTKEKNMIRNGKDKHELSRGSSSSFSSADYKRKAQPELLSFDQALSLERNNRESIMSRTSSSSHLPRPTLDLRDVVKDSMYREARTLSLKTTIEEEVPKQRSSSDLRESIDVLAKLKGTPQNLNGDVSKHPLNNNVSRLSCDGKDLKELPRLSLDSRERSIGSLNSDLKTHFPLRHSKSQREVGSSSNSGTPQCPSVVGQLMGLGNSQRFRLDIDGKVESIMNFPVEESNSFSRSSTLADSNQIQNSPRSNWREPSSPRRKNPDIVMKPIPNSRLPSENAPWKSSSNSFPSVYGEIEKRLKDLEFTQSSKDLRALKQILEAMQAKGLLEMKKEEDGGDYEQKYKEDQNNSQLVNQQRPSCSTDDNSTKFESPIIIMKPAKLIDESCILASKFIPMDILSRVPERKDGEYSLTGRRKLSSQSSRNRIQKTTATSSNSALPDDRKKSIKTARSPQTSSMNHQLPKQTTSLVKNSESVSPRLQQKKHELERRSRPPTPPEPKKKWKQNKEQPELSSPGGKRRTKLAKAKIKKEQSIDSDNLSTQSEGHVFSDSGNETEFSFPDKHTGTNESPSSKLKIANLLLSEPEKKLSVQLSENVAADELARVTPAQPSPISVLDYSIQKGVNNTNEKQLSPVIKDGSLIVCGDSSNENISPDSTDKILLKSEINREKLENIETLVQKLKRVNSAHDESENDYIASLCEDLNPDHRYICEILLASGLILRDLDSSLVNFQLHPSNYPINPELFMVLEQTKAATFDEDQMLHRKLIFDAINEILVEKFTLLSLPPQPRPKPMSGRLTEKPMNGQMLLRDLCLEVDKLLQNQDKFDSSPGKENEVLQSIIFEDLISKLENSNDMAVDVYDVVLNVERMIFKDLIEEIVFGDATCFASQSQ
ncbi:protein LONGIFOLIA 2-like [Impatiens glandulifera]|uniref:protein LONGIFOLIA 2-like n=1 Tax=Impatiens glandulifera TaxID=253017 RepID=UPI001FB0934D|nr:protein LONGIFOLIA 2-like [Impatiens glandulifera]